MTQRSIPHTSQLLSENQRFFATYRESGVAAGADSAVVLSAPSDKHVFIDEVRFTCDGPADIQVTQAVNIDSSGTELDAPSLKVDGNGVTSDSVFEHSGTYSGGTQIGLDRIPSAAAGAARVGGSSDEPQFLLVPGENVRFTVTNQASSSSVILHRIDFYEVPDVASVI